MELKLDLSKPSMIVAYHPVTIARDTTYETAALFAALRGEVNRYSFVIPMRMLGAAYSLRKPSGFWMQGVTGACLSISVRWFTGVCWQMWT